MSVKKDYRKRYISALPDSAFEPTMELISNKEALIEGCEGIIEYNDSLVSINCRKTSITIEGSSINLRTLASNTVEVTGEFTNISFSML